MSSGDNPFVTVVSGLPRSGTSMMMQMLQEGGIDLLTDHVRAADEDNLKGYYELEAVKRTKQDDSWLQGAAGKAVKIIYMLLYDLPDSYDYRVVFMRRKLDEVLASQQTMLARRDEKGAALSTQQMADVFRSQLNKVDDWLAEQSNFKVLNVDYHRAVADPLGVARQINEFLGAALDISAMAAAVDSGLYRQRQP